jgi:phenylacetate-CoA ligase
MEHMFEQEFNPNELNLARIILVGEPVIREDVTDLEERLHVSVWRHYGLSEIPGPAMAHECPDHGGLHMSDDHIFTEIVDPATGRAVEPGEKGELVLTTLSVRAFPLIRFRTGDMARLVTEPCGCGSNLMKMEIVPERTDSLLIISGIKISLPQVNDYLARALNMEHPRCTILKTRSMGTEILSISVAMDDALFSDEIKELESLVKRTQEALEEQIGVGVRITLMQGR